MRKMFIPLLTIVVIILLVVFYRSGGQDMKRYAPLVEPRIENLEPQKMLVIELKGDPSQTSREAFDQLFKTYYRLKFPKKSFSPGAPRARWTGDPRDRKSWIGVFGLPIPENLTNLPPGTDQRLKIVTWPYGETAVILHKGAYTNEKPDIDKLNAFIKTQGYRVVGEHEEEYLTPPSSNPERFYTIIRYRVAKAGR